MSDYSGNWLHIGCSCGRSMASGVSLLLSQHHGDRPIGQFVSRLKCQKCGAAPASVTLSESHMAHAYGGSSPGWVVELTGARTRHDGSLRPSA